MNIFFGVLFFLWGIVVILLGLKKLSEADLKSKGKINSPYFEVEWLTRWIQNLPTALIRAFVIFIGVSFSGFGLFLLVW
ncbi:hypothetical protein [Geomicrobium sp. JCM 19055]|uniref:hypothetical protein n=1 Tax=Geomicrobium sp. JCM 19055 TaxID=1460649 RepID=UPI00045ECF89|nr:hypothetical protein [Geomicrobium sp. JCM 19055]GAJ97837.1 hypothetical protein JCM19055_720 [Geomicrobium sp. JCM 19055]